MFKQLLMPQYSESPLLKPYHLFSPPGLYNPVFQDPKALQLGVAVCHVPDFSLRLC